MTDDRQDKSTPHAMRDAMDFASKTFRSDAQRNPREPHCFPPTLFLDGTRPVVSPILGGGRSAVLLAIAHVVSTFRPKSVAMLFEGKVQDTPQHDHQAPADDIYDAVLVLGVEWGRPGVLAVAKIEGGKLAKWGQPSEAQGQYLDAMQRALSDAWRGVN